MKNHIYRGVRTRTGDLVLVDGMPLDPRLDIRNHSPTGFSWGYSGSGPSQLALAIMVKEYGEETIHHPINYQDLKWAVVAGLQGDWQFSSRELRDTVDCIRVEMENPRTHTV